MRRGTRRGLAVADDLRIFIRDDAPEDAASPELSPASPSSVASTPSPTSTAFQPTTTGTDLPSPTTTTFTPPTITKTNSSFSTTTTIPPKITSSAVPFLNHPQLSSSALPSSISISSSSIVISSAHVSVTTKPTPTSAGIVLAPAVSDYTSITTTPSPILSNAPTSSATAAHLAVPDITSSSSVAAESVATTTDGLGSNPINHDDYGRVHLDAGSVAGIAVGSSAGTILMAAIIFFLYKKWGKRSEKITSDNSDSDPASGSGVRRYLSRRYTHKSDDRIMNDLMTAAYSAESGRRDSFQDQMPVNVNGYLTEKKRQMTEDDEIPIMMMSEPEPVAQPAFKRTKRISKWLRRHDSQMLNPDLARASLASNATGLRSLDLESMSGMGSDDGYSDYGRSTEPLSNLRPPPRQKKQEQPTYSEPLNTKGDVQEEQDEREEQDEQDEQEEIPNLQGLNVRIRDSTPVAQFPTPEELNLPPPPGRPTSIAARTENTGRSSGTWNTWGVTQHREEPKGWKAKLGM